MTRPSWEEYALALAEAARARSEDPYVQVGAAILGPDNEVLATGYNGAPAGVEMDWDDRDERRLRVIHAESNALRYVRPNEATLVATTLMPCLECLKLIRSYGIYEVVFRGEYGVPSQTEKIAAEFGVRLRRM
jgi:dCMP deaminase